MLYCSCHCLVYALGMHRKFVEKIRAITTQSLTVATSGQLKIVKETVPGAEPTKMFQDIMISWMFGLILFTSTFSERKRPEVLVKGRVRLMIVSLQLAFYTSWSYGVPKAMISNRVKDAAVKWKEERNSWLSISPCYVHCSAFNALLTTIIQKNYSKAFFFYTNNRD